MNCICKVPLDAIFANQEIFIFNLVRYLWTQVMIVEPIFTLITLNHEVFDILYGMRLFTIAIAVKVVLIVVILIIFVIEFFII